MTTSPSTTPARVERLAAAGLAEYPVGAVLTVLQDQLVCDLDELKSLLGHVTGESVWSHDMPYLADRARPFLEAVFPTLVLVADGMPTFAARPGWHSLDNEHRKQQITDWLNDTLIDYGHTVVVPRMPAGYVP